MESLGNDRGGRYGGYRGTQRGWAKVINRLVPHIHRGRGQFQRLIIEINIRLAGMIGRQDNVEAQSPPLLSA